MPEGFVADLLIGLEDVSERFCAADAKPQGNEGGQHARRGQILAAAVHGDGDDEILRARVGMHQKAPGREHDLVVGHALAAGQILHTGH